MTTFLNLAVFGVHGYSVILTDVSAPDIFIISASSSAVSGSPSPSIVMVLVTT